MSNCSVLSFFFFFNDTATTEIYTLSLHDALPICDRTVDLGTLPGFPASLASAINERGQVVGSAVSESGEEGRAFFWRSEEHTSELQSRQYLVCRLLLEKKKIQ